jgi:hypothetical protein
MVMIAAMPAAKVIWPANTTQRMNLLQNVFKA